MNLNKFNLIIFFTFITNFKPTYIKSLKNLNFISVYKKNTILCRNLFLFLFLLKYLKKQHKNSIWIKPLKKKKLTLLRAPYRYKLSRNQIELTRYYIYFKLAFKFDKLLIIKKTNEIYYIFNFFKNYNLWLESNIIYQFKTKIIFNFLWNINPCNII